MINLKMKTTTIYFGRLKPVTGMQPDYLTGKEMGYYLKFLGVMDKTRTVGLEKEYGNRKQQLQRQILHWLLARAVGQVQESTVKIAL